MEIHIWDPNSLYIWNPALYRFSGIHRWGPGAGRSATSSCRGDGGARQGLQLDSLEQFLASRPETGGPSVLLPFEVRTTGGNRFHTKAIESSECVRGRPARSSTISVSEAPQASAQEDATLLVEWALNLNGQGTPVPDKPGWWHPLSSGPSSAWRWHSLSAGLRDRQRAGLRSWSFASCQRSVSMLGGTSKARAGSASSGGSACRLTTWSLNGVVGTLGT